MSTDNANQCARCATQWTDQIYPLKGNREQCGKCGNLRVRLDSPRPTDLAAASMAATMELFTAGVMTFEVNSILHQAGLPWPKEHRNPRRINQFIRLLRENNPPPRVGPGGEWAIAQIYSDSQEGGRNLAIVFDKTSQLIISAGAEPVGSMPGSTLRLALARAKGPPTKITTNILGLSMNQAIEEQIRQSHAVRRESLDDITRDTRLAEFIRVIELRKKFQGKPTQEFLDNLLEILMQDLNFFRAMSLTNHLSPAQLAGIQPKYQNWEEAAVALTTRNGRPNNLLTHDPSLEEAPTHTSMVSPGVSPPGPAVKNPDGERPTDDAGLAAGLTAGHAPNGLVGNSLVGNDILLDELQSFIEQSEAKRDEIRKELDALDDAADAAWKLHASLEGRENT